MAMRHVTRPPKRDRFRNAAGNRTATPRAPPFRNASNPEGELNSGFLRMPHIFNPSFSEDAIAAFCNMNILWAIVGSLPTFFTASAENADQRRDGEAAIHASFPYVVREGPSVHQIIRERSSPVYLDWT
jgi:hypothetical protein